MAPRIAPGLVGCRPWPQGGTAACGGLGAEQARAGDGDRRAVQLHDHSIVFISSLHSAGSISARLLLSSNEPSLLAYVCASAASLDLLYFPKRARSHLSSLYLSNPIVFSSPLSASELTTDGSLDDDAGDALPLPDPSPTTFAGGSSTRDMASVSEQPRYVSRATPSPRGWASGSTSRARPSPWGYQRAIYFYPDRKNREDNSTYISLLIALASEGTDVRPTPQDHSLESGTYTLKYCVSMW
ncbi:hypothetical protein QYE76_010142 [Lolium multiflorum]|uniref:Uncharacterized protein n=1 Tax=Lolium multiflorum TaxID=4521 RepID=A0AAD8TT35_LOLMU|nr:hypothetical protein QYE76_010142 [Lolium multiflorum]